MILYDIIQSATIQHIVASRKSESRRFSLSRAASGGFHRAETRPTAARVVQGHSCLVPLARRGVPKPGM